jgi:HTH-like domain
MKDPCLGRRRLMMVLERDHGIKANRKRVARLRREIGQEAIWCKPRTSIPDYGTPSILTCGVISPSTAPRPRLPVRRDGLALAQGARLVAFQHHGNRPLPGGFANGVEVHRQRSPGDFQHRSE